MLCQNACTAVHTAWMMLCTAAIELVTRLIIADQIPLKNPKMAFQILWIKAEIAFITASLMACHDASAAVTVATIVCHIAVRKAEIALQMASIAA